MSNATKAALNRPRRHRNRHFMEEIEQDQRFDRRAFIKTVQRSFRFGRRKSGGNKSTSNININNSYDNNNNKKIRSKRNEIKKSLDGSSPNESEKTPSAVFSEGSGSEASANDQQEQYKGTKKVVFNAPTPVPADPIVNLDREEKRLESYDIYILVSILSATSSFATIQGASTPPDDDDDIMTICIHTLSIICSVASFLTGIYATIVFSFCLLYAKTALGLQRDEMYNYFTKATTKERVRGFRAFTISLWLFIIELILVATEKITWFKWPFMIATSCCCAYVIQDMQIISNKASSIFTNKFPQQLEQQQQIDETNIDDDINDDGDDDSS